MGKSFAVLRFVVLNRDLPCRDRLVLVLAAEEKEAVIQEISVQRLHHLCRYNNAGTRDPYSKFYARFVRHRQI